MLKTPNATPGHTQINSDKPRNRRFDEIDIDGDLFGFDAEFVTFNGELESVVIRNATKAVGDCDLAVTGSDLEVLESVAWDFWEVR